MIYSRQHSTLIMQYFTKDFSTFFKGLAKNNNKAWFDKHRKIYEEHVKKAFVKLVEDLLPEIQKLDPEVRMLPKEAIFRINRDIRFSKDKTPYNTMVKAAFAQGGRKSSYAGYYIGISADTIHVGGGSFGIDPESLDHIRNHIVKKTPKIIKLSEQKKFKELFGEIKGEKNKRIPSDYQETFKKTDLIANKQFYYMADYKDPKLITSEKLLPFLVDHFKVITPLNSFLKKGLA